MKPPTLVMLCGVPCTGKTTFRDQYYGQAEWAIISSDDAVERIAAVLDSTYNEVFSDAIKLAEKHMWKEAARAVENVWGIVWDQTNLTVKNRKKKLTLVPEHYRKIAYVFEMPTRDVLDARLLERETHFGKSIPAEVIDRMINSFERPSFEEGFDQIEDVVCHD